MPANYTVVAAEKISDKPDRGYGPMQTIRLTLKNEAGAERAGIEWYTKASTDVPAPGSQMFGEAKEGQYGWTFKRAQQGPYNGRSGAPRDFKADPVKNAAIAAEASQKVAVDTIRLAIETKQDPAELARKVVEVSRILCADITAAMNEAK